MGGHRTHGSLDGTAIGGIMWWVPGVPGSDRLVPLAK